LLAVPAGRATKTLNTGDKTPAGEFRDVLITHKNLPDTHPLFLAGIIAIPLLCNRNTVCMFRIMILLLIAFSILHCSPMTTSSTDAGRKLDGVYSLQGVHDMAAGFKFSKDGTFEFFYIYGVADRFAKGTYTIEGDTLKLKSNKVGGKDFPITHQSKKGDGFMIKATDPNPYVLHNLTAICVKNGEGTPYQSDDQGVIRIDDTSCEEIYMMHEIFPDIATPIKTKDNDNNYFEVTLSPALMEVSFQGIDFHIEGDTLSCIPNYFLPFDSVAFVKEN
jgi:hypothetical protein